MAGSLNKVQIIGRVGKPPELRYTQGGKATTSFSVAVNGYARQGEEPTVEWFSVTTWDKLADTANQLINTGRLVYVEGRLQTRSWEGQDGQKRYRTEVVAQSFLLLDSKPGQQNAQQDDSGVDDGDSLDVPF